MENPWRLTAQMRRQEFLKDGHSYERMQKMAFVLSEEMRKSMRIPAFPQRWKSIFHESGEDWPHKVRMAIMRIAVKWPPIRVAMPDGRRLDEHILQELGWLKDGFCANLIEECGIPEEGYGRPLTTGMIMVDWLRAFGDLVQTYLRDEIVVR
jgi:hypothetical protein